ncbi:hypothetical protein [Methanoregula sp.]|uniref:hypothetical protein n=1 Tax=Methanoregula sp. TaxID=2052170 RepID=UPI002C6870BF|nr:hypothetical protein [Methanoregula sp.]HVP97031.1 hypothetical protein [Methanoregula sp.]
MKDQSRAFFCLALLTVCVLLAAGCTTPRMGDTHNTTIVIQDYNQWAAQQNASSAQVKTSLAQLGSTLDAYNRDTAGSSPDPATLRGDVAADQQAIGQWGAAIQALQSATGTFSSDTSALEFGSDGETPHLAGLLAQEMKIYTIQMGNAQQHFVDYTQDMSTYLSVDDPDYRDDAMRTAAMDAKAQAISSLDQSDLTLSNITATAQLLQQRQ